MPFAAERHNNCRCWPPCSGVPLRALMAALSACLANREAFPPEAAASALGQLVGRSPLPPLFMRFVMQVRSLYVHPAWACLCTLALCTSSKIHPGPLHLLYLQAALVQTLFTCRLHTTGGILSCRRVRRGPSSSPLCWSC
jgi:Symplekin tight junction protein C terminal